MSTMGFYLHGYNCILRGLFLKQWIASMMRYKVNTQDKPATAQDKGRFNHLLL